MTDVLLRRVITDFPIVLGVFCLLAALSAGKGAASEEDSTAAAHSGPYIREQWKSRYTRPAVAPGSPTPLTAGRETLGRTLFFDPRLSGSGWISCATCHNPGLSWGDRLTKGIGNAMQPLGRRTPTLLNVSEAELLFWDGRAASLEEQALGPIASAAEMNLPLPELVRTVTAKPAYRAMFARAYPGEQVDEKTIGRALAAFERSIISGPAPFDEWLSGHPDALSASAQRGFDLFNTKAGCAQCHTGWSFSDQGFHDIGLADGDLGRGARLQLEAMQHAFKTPTLRSVDRRAPYMHDGSEATLEDVIELYDRGGRVQRPSLSPEIHPLHLTAAEKRDLLAFLGSLTGVDPVISIPELPR